MQERRSSIANALESRIPSTKPSIDILLLNRSLQATLECSCDWITRRCGQSAHSATPVFKTWPLIVDSATNQSEIPRPIPIKTSHLAQSNSWATHGVVKEPQTVSSEWNCQQSWPSHHPYHNNNIAVKRRCSLMNEEVKCQLVIIYLGLEHGYS